MGDKLRIYNGGGEGSRRLRIIAPLLIILVLSAGMGCRHRQLAADARIRLEISPPVISPGVVVMVKVFTPDDAVRVVGSAQVLGSPRYSLKRDEECGCWGGRAMIPIDAVIVPGVYTMRAEVKYADGSWGYGICEIEYR